ncbi:MULTISPECIES: aldo/keto reductase [Staphylococcus]|uniref:2,5-diketo-D-gluconic acid reductase n=1 Tax=Staphylococcus agnetis TaxID=985762 RepID=A0A2T4MJB9_9STAP|nr:MULTISPECIES: aldo/keto reductase [Staphylococcus]ALN76587.1 aldo/keto reductase [Staphylococcus agnetis]MDG4942645.1 aldo/keto reductase [Staphylococcus agnetis]NHM93156.1 aldo/keto reductase [Staphylococcus sp. 10602379]NJI03424.1 aldo/keto reductase [Staphylococcus agnetis]NJI14171.1 aldo/keto reductase [Staphylococcus agnetis]
MYTYTFNDGHIIPQVGFGTYKLNGVEGVHAIQNALKVGYRVLDTAYNYENEGAVGKAIAQSKVAREDITIISKLPGRYQAYDDVFQTIEESLYRLGVDYIDIYLIHWPNPKQGLYVEAWKAMIAAKKAGLIRSIGVCNFLPEYIETLKQATGVLPVLNQIELHPYFNQEAMFSYHEENQILIQAWSPIGRDNGLLKEPILQELAHKYTKSVVQIILRWHIQRGIMPIPKATSHARQLENLQIFDFNISDADMTLINQLSKIDGRRKGQDPSIYEEF